MRKTTPNIKLIAHMGIKTENAFHAIASLSAINIGKRIDETNDNENIIKIADIILSVSFTNS